MTDQNVANEGQLQGDPFTLNDEIPVISPLPWTAKKADVRTQFPYWDVYSANGSSVVAVCAKKNTKEDAEFIANAANAFAPLNADRKWLEGEVARLKEVLEGIANADGDDIEEVALRCTRAAAAALAYVAKREDI